MGSQTYVVTTGLHIYNVQEAVPTGEPLSMDDGAFQDLVEYLQNQGLMENTGVSKFVTREQETLP